MTVQKAVFYLQRYQKEVAFMPHRAAFKYMRKKEFRRVCLENQLVDYLIGRIRRNPWKDPRDTIRDYYDEMESMIAQSENRLTWEFCSIMENGAHDILVYLAHHVKED